MSRVMLGILMWGAVAILGIASITTEAPGPAPTERNWVIGRLHRDQAFGQTFVAAAPELTALRVLLFAPNAERDDPVTLRLRYAAAPGPDLATVTLPMRDLARQGMTAFPLPPLRIQANPHSAAAPLLFTLEAPTLPPDAGISVIAGPDTYPDGLMLIAGEARPFGDLAFQPLYRRHWIDPLLPISTLAAGKPGLPGWPPLYPLLAYGYLCLLGYGLHRLWQRARETIDAS